MNHIVPLKHSLHSPSFFFSPVVAYYIVKCHRFAFIFRLLFLSIFHIPLPAGPAYHRSLRHILSTTYTIIQTIHLRYKVYAE